MADFKDHFSRVAATYASFRPRYPAALFDYLAGLPRARKLAWDCACGNGQATIDLTERFERVVATDASRAQLENAARHERVTYRVAPADRSGLAAASVDLVTIAQALHWLDVERFYAEVRRVLAPGGALAAWVYGNPTIDAAPIDALVRDFYERVVGPYWPAERAHIVSGLTTLPFPFAELAHPPFAMQVDWTLEQLRGYLLSWSATQRFIEMHRVDPLDEFFRVLEPAWGDPRTRRTVRWPLWLRVGRATSE